MIEEAVIKDCAKGRKSAQKTLYNAYAKKMFLLCYRYLNQKEDAEEVVSEGFIKIFLNLSKIEYRDLPTFEAWMRKVFANESLMYLRKRNRRFVYDFEHKSIAIPSDIEDELNAQSIYKMVLDLPDGYRIIFNLYAIEGYTHKEISQKLNIAESTSRSQLTKAREMLKRRISKIDL